MTATTERSVRRGAPSRSTSSTDERRGNRPKHYARAAVAGVVMTVGILGIVVAAASISAVSNASETDAIFNDAGSLPPELVDAVTWRPDAPDSGRRVEPLTRERVTISWLRAWEQIRITAETGDTSGLAVSFSNSALEGVASLASNGTTHSLRQLGHDVQVTFYSDDGQVLGLTAHASEFVHTETGVGRTLERRSIESFDAVLLLEDGHWRIHHLVRRSVDVDPWVDVTR